jgi:hypothetical protein
LFLIILFQLLFFVQLILLLLDYLL